MVTEQMQSPPVELDPYKVELTRYQKGNYGWVIRVTGKDMARVLEDVQSMDKELKHEYPIAKGE